MPIKLSVTCVSIFLYALCLTMGCEANLVVQNVNGTKHEINSIQIIYGGNPSLPLADVMTLATATNINETNGLIFIITSNLPVENVVLEAEKNGAAAVIVISTLFYEPGFLVYRVNDKNVAASITVPLFEVPIGDGQTLRSLLANNQVANVTIMPDDSENQWIVTSSSGGVIAASVILSAFSLVNMGLASWKMAVFVRHYGGFKSSIALYVLCIEMFANIIRFIASVNFAPSAQLYPDWASQLFTELSLPFAISSYMLFTLYWHEMMTNATVVVHPFITKMKIPFFIASALLVCLQIVRSIVRNIVEGDFSLATSVIYLAVIIAEVIFYGVTGTKLLKRLHHSKHLGRTVNLQKSTIKIMVGMGFAVLFAVITSLFVARIPYRPIPWIVVWGVLTALLDAASLMNIMAFELPSKHSSKTSSNGSSNRTSTTLNQRASI